MTTEQTREFLALLDATKEQLNYLRELGVELAEPVAEMPAGHREADRVTTQNRSPATAAPAIAEVAPTAGSSLFGDLGRGSDRLEQSQETFAAIHQEIGDCTRCPLHLERTNVVHTEGNQKARLMFVGEAPGADEDIQSRPFVGRAGQLLTKIIEAIGFKREEVLIGNINRCRPPGNRAPTAEEAAMCKPFLVREIASAQPQVIVVLGNTAMRNLLDTREGITRLRGKFQDYKGIPVMPTFHPAFLLRDPSRKRETWEDLKKVRDFLDQSATDRTD